jgi:hypothetical protein
LHLKRDEPLSDVAFKFNVRRYTSVHHYGWYVDMGGSQDDSLDDQEADQPPLRVKVYIVSTPAHWVPNTHTHTRLSPD